MSTIWNDWLDRYWRTPDQVIIRDLYWMHRFERRMGYPVSEWMSRP